MIPTGFKGSVRLSLMTLAITSTAALAAVSADEAAKLSDDPSTELNAMGGIQAGNEKGTIPAWQGKVLASKESIEMSHEALQALKEDDPGELALAFQGEIIKRIDEMKERHIKQRAAWGIEGEQTFAAVEDMFADGLKSDERIARITKMIEEGPAKPMFTVTAKNMDKYADFMTVGHKALMKRYPDTYFMNVYPTYRPAFFPDEVNAATKENATRASLNGTDGVKDAVLGFPFPIPKTGAEVIWNHKLKFRGSAVIRYNNQAIVKPDGDWKFTKVVEDVKFKYANLEEYKEVAEDGLKVLAYYLAETKEPPRLAGQLILVHETADQESGSRAAWIYSKATSRVNRAPDVGYDNPSVGTDGEQFNDQVDVFNGALNYYDWKLIGRKEILIPYNSYYMNAPWLKYDDIIRPGHVNMKYPRYELHRVWVVDATLTTGVKHQLKRRTFYLDEDSWSIAAVDGYDNRDELWKFQEAHLATFPFVPTTTGSPEAIHDLQSGRYFLTALTNEDDVSNFDVKFKDKEFKPSALRKRIK